ncbi:methyltransferase domain-containing protein [Sporolactobacillus sp. THM19-2]|uniref:methyltransferase domain-containing protein n=1 Tax=Sporolactobacillus sp. THM19-2 TaxID=2511171 RepID=UPI002DBB090A|nr:methyltransferase domain-containing protein [Sporolactobacillus sp. THM19-2]
MCGSSMKVTDLKSMICINRHTFDFSRQGYLNLLNRKVHDDYGKELFEARRKVMFDLGFFNPLIRQITQMIRKATGMPGKNLKIADMGCGEGTHLAALCRLLQKTNHVTGVGMDLSKAGIEQAAKKFHSQTWIVADLTQPPFFPGSFDIILNILSPSNYQVFDHLLHPDGFVIKVVPERRYLQELRRYLYKNSSREKYSNSEILAHFRQNYPDFQSKQFSYTCKMDAAGRQSLICMTPLAWNTDDDTRRIWALEGPEKVTVDVMILIGKKQDLKDFK